MLTPLKEFQARHGSEYNGIITSEAFAQALAIANAEKVLAISVLTDEEIKQNGLIILADFRGHLRYEAALLGLHERKEFVFGTLPAEEYADPIVEAHEEMMAERGAEPDEEEQTIEDLATTLMVPKAKRLRKKAPGRKKKKKR